ncbi:hypothetical protein M422DRAFT_107013, partial [Sphaerobolus stellatus SS14]
LINLTWFLALVCSLSAAFVAMLAKQWLHAYTMDTHDPLDMHALQRHFRYTGFTNWKTSKIIYSLPVLLQISFGLFFIGLDILVWSLNRPIGYLTISGTAVLLLFYLFTTLAP